MRIAVMGTGGMGGYLGAKLAAAGEDVTFIARGPHLAAIQANGLQVKGVEPLEIRPAKATDDPATVGLVDGVLFCVKLYDTESAAASIGPMVGPDTWTLTVQNGVESAGRIASVIGEGHTLGGAAYFPANITGPGEVTYLGKIANKPHLILGEADGGGSARAEQLAVTFNAAGIRTEVCADTASMLWEKFCLMAGTSAVMGLTRQDIGTVRNDPDMRWVLTQAVAEAAAVGRAVGIALPHDVEARTLSALDGNPASAKASLLVDLERGRRLELEGLSGALVRLGAKHGIATPVHRLAYAALKSFVDGV